MNATPPPAPRRLAATLATPVLLALLVTLSACGSSGSGDAGSGAAGGATSSTAAEGHGGTGSTLDTIPGGTATIDIGTNDLGQVLVDLTGHTLYVFTQDTPGTPTCTDESCTKVWPPLVGTGLAVGSGVPVQPGEFKLVPRPDGTTQAAVDGRPLYRYSGDAGPGEANGQGVNGSWFAVRPDGTPITG